MASSAQMENTKLLELARKQRMNTDVRKNVFLVMMTSEVSNFKPSSLVFYPLYLDFVHHRMCVCYSRVQ